MFKRLSTIIGSHAAVVQQNLVQGHNSSVLAALHRSSYCQAKPTFALNVLLPANIPYQQCEQTLWKMVVCRLSWFLEYHKILSISQSGGFRQRRKNTDHILRLDDAIQKSLGNQHNVLSVFIDLEKAYDRDNKDVLLSKLLRYGI